MGIIMISVPNDATMALAQERNLLSTSYGSTGDLDCYFCGLTLVYGDFDMFALTFPLRQCSAKSTEIKLPGGKDAKASSVTTFTYFDDMYYTLKGGCYCW
jgi:hypothetical protein